MIIIGSVNIPLLEMDRSSREEISKDLVEPNTIYNWTQWTSTDYIQQHNTYSSQAHVEYLPRETTFRARKHTFTN